uniref:Uncharacterized protein n=1 Tax=Arundo donax TaxID=35708 RepID=A0A0A9AA44_ARUDO
MAADTAAMSSAWAAGTGPSGSGFRRRRAAPRKESRARQSAT